ncbi:MAG: hypothetical protein GWP91_15050 [Rhodobacterales bacterium]|nr:hypothetical protein [Rhodobacterales bacterium]
MGFTTAKGYSRGVKLAARQRTYGALWVFAGCLLCWRSLPYLGLVQTDTVSLTTAELPVALGLALVVGVLKGWFMLRKSAEFAGRRMLREGKNAPWWTLFRPPVLVLLGVMIAMGVALRHGPYDDQIKAWLVGVGYLAIAIALWIGGGTLLIARRPTP